MVVGVVMFQSGETRGIGKPVCSTSLLPLFLFLTKGATIEQLLRVPYEHRFVHAVNILSDHRSVVQTKLRVSISVDLTPRALTVMAMALISNYCRQ